jgi:hypothetical protein
MADGLLNRVFGMDDLPNGIMRDIYQYWQDIRGDRNMPSRADLIPENIVRLLPHLTLVDVEEKTGRYKFRLIGTETVKTFGKDVTGKYLDEMPEVERYLKVRYEWLVREKKPYFIFDKLKWAQKLYLDYYVLGLPLSQNGHDVTMFLFGTYYQFPNVARTDYYDLGA